MPNYLIISNTTVVDANTDVYARNFKAITQLLIGNSSVYSTLTSTSLTVPATITSGALNTFNITALTSLTVGNSSVQVGITGSGISTTGSMTASNLTLNNQMTLGSVLVQNGTVNVGNTRITNTNITTTNLNIGSQITANSIVGVNTLQSLNISSQFVNTSIMNVSSGINIGNINTTPSRMSFNGGVDHVWKTNSGNYYVQHLVDAADNFSTNLYNSSGNYYGTAHYFKVATNTLPTWNILLPTNFASSMLVNGPTIIDDTLNVTGSTTTNTLIVNQSSVYSALAEFRANVIIKNDLKVTREVAGSPNTGYLFFGETGACLLYNGTDFYLNTGSLTVPKNIFVGEYIQSPNVYVSGGEFITHRNNNTGDIYFGVTKNASLRFDGTILLANKDLYLPNLIASGTIGGLNVIAAGGDMNTHRNSNVGFLTFGNDKNSNIYSDGNNLVYTAKSTQHYFNGTAYATAFVQSSDKRLKNLDKYLDNSEAMNYIMKMNPLSFRWKDNNDHRSVMGFFAQDLQEVLPDMVNTNKDGILTIELGQIIPLLVGAIKQLKDEINTMKTNTIGV